MDSEAILKFFASPKTYVLDIADVLRICHISLYVSEPEVFRLT